MAVYQGLIIPALTARRAHLFVVRGKCILLSPMWGYLFARHYSIRTIGCYISNIKSDLGYVVGADMANHQTLTGLPRMPDTNYTTTRDPSPRLSVSSTSGPPPGPLASRLSVTL